MDVKKIIDKVCSNKNFSKYIVVIGILGMLMIFVSGFFKNDTKKDSIAPIKNLSLEDRREKLEKNLESIISNIQGAGSSRVLVTLETSTETVYATEERKNEEASEDKSSGEITRKKASNDSEKRFITVKDSEGTEHALAITEIEPKVKGVVVICPGGDDILVKKRIVEATTTALNIKSTQVCVTKSS